MPSVELYRKTLPDWTALRALEESEIEAIVELIVALTQVGGLNAHAPAYAALKASWVDLFCASDWVARASFSAHVDACDLRIRRLFEHPRAADILLVSVCSRLRASDTQFQALCLSIVTTFYSDSNPQQSELVYRVGKRFNLSKTRIDELFARLRAASNATPTQRKPGKPAPQQNPQKHRGHSHEEAKLSTDSVETPRR